MEAQQNMESQKETAPEWEEIEEVLDEAKEKKNSLNKDNRETLDELESAVSYGLRSRTDQSYDAIHQLDRIGLHSKKAGIKLEKESGGERSVLKDISGGLSSNLDNLQLSNLKKLRVLENQETAGELTSVIEDMPATSESAREMDEREVDQFMERMDGFNLAARTDIHEHVDGLAIVSGDATSKMVDEMAQCDDVFSARKNLLMKAHGIGSEKATEYSDASKAQEDYGFSDEVARTVTAYGAGVMLAIATEYQDMESVNETSTNHNRNHAPTSVIEESLEADDDLLSSEAYTEAQKEFIMEAAKYGETRGEDLTSEELGAIILETRRQEEGIDVDEEETAGRDIKKHDNYAELRSAADNMLYDENTNIGNGTLSRFQREKLVAGASYVREEGLEVNRFERELA